MTVSVKTEQPVRVLFVCLGNICRSPTAEAVFRQQVQQAGWQAMIQTDSAGTAAWHEGKAPDARSQQHARVRGYDLSALRARQVKTSDFADFDHIIAMDAANYAELERLRADAGDTAKARLVVTAGSSPRPSWRRCARPLLWRHRRLRAGAGSGRNGLHAAIALIAENPGSIWLWLLS